MGVLVHGAYEAGAPNADTIIDFQFSDDREIQGGDVSAWVGVAGDRITMGVYDPSSGTPVEVRRLATNVALPANKIYTLRVGYSMTLPAGAIFRIIYTSVGVTAPEITANILTWLQGTGV
jgi:hypothetical protein